MKNALSRFAALFMAVAMACASHADVLSGRVVKVADGDTITVLDSSKTQHKIRLNRIDAPEKSQAFGQKSRQHLSDLVAGREVRVEWSKKDKYARVLGVVFVGGMDVNLQMVRDGFAWHYKRFDSTPAYAAAEAEARKNRLGLWADSNPIQPEVFRHGGGGSTKLASAPGSTASTRATTAREEYRPGNAMPVSSRAPAPVCDKWPETGYWLSTNSSKRHNRRCENYRKTRGYPCGKNDGTPCRKCGG